jgi:hypothetical protein
MTGHCPEPTGLVHGRLRSASPRPRVADRDDADACVSSRIPPPRLTLFTHVMIIQFCYPE